jgi:hypothetical protein
MYFAWITRRDARGAPRRRTFGQSRISPPVVLHSSDRRPVLSPTLFFSLQQHHILLATRLFRAPRTRQECSSGISIHNHNPRPFVSALPQFILPCPLGPSRQLCLSISSLNASRTATAANSSNRRDMICQGSNVKRECKFVPTNFNSRYLRFASKSAAHAFRSVGFCRLSARETAGETRLPASIFRPSNTL